jgi:anaerobic dimethyl sulfoxide reductase subunit B (iron-sulfur subunit)
VSGFLLDLNRCVGCGACVLACRIQNALPGGVSWRRILTLNQRRAATGPTYHFSLACHHCEDPPCARGCPSGALVKRQDGIVLLEEELCIGCRYCEMACPFGAPSFDVRRGVMTKCHLCAPRQDAGLAPACTEACPTGALRFAPDLAATGVLFEDPVETPGFADPGDAGANLRLAPPRGGLRAERLLSLKALIRQDGEGDHA